MRRRALTVLRCGYGARSSASCRRDTSSGLPRGKRMAVDACRVGHMDADLVNHVWRGPSASGLDVDADVASIICKGASASVQWSGRGFATSASTCQPLTWQVSSSRALGGVPLSSCGAQCGRGVHVPSIEWIRTCHVGTRVDRCPMQMLNEWHSEVKKRCAWSGRGFATSACNSGIRGGRNGVDVEIVRRATCARRRAATWQNQLSPTRLSSATRLSPAVSEWLGHGRTASDGALAVGHGFRSSLSTVMLPFPLRGLLTSRVRLVHGDRCDAYVKEDEASRVQQTVLVRDFIEDSLYNPVSGYFSKANDEVVGRIPEPIDFKALRGRSAYMELVSRLYEERDQAWLTPVEILKIHEIGGGNGTCALNILDHIKATAPSSVYRDLKYTSFEISPALAERQRSTVHAHGKHRGKYTVKQCNAMHRESWGAADTTGCFVIMLEVLDNLPHDRIVYDHRSGQLMETVVQSRCVGGGGGGGGDDQQLVEHLRPIQDPLVLACLDIMGGHLRDLHRPMTVTVTPSSEKDASPQSRQLVDLPDSRGGSSTKRECIGGGKKSWLSSIIEAGRLRFANIGRKKVEIVWIPTGAMGLLEVLYAARPNLSLIAADFTVLPDVIIEGERAPLVASKKAGVTADHPTYLVPKGSADIFFPTDFSLLEKMDRAAVLAAQKERMARSGKDNTTSAALSGLQSSSAELADDHVHPFRWSATVSPSSFMERFADLKQTETISGFNPLLEDYSNTNFFLTGPR